MDLRSTPRRLLVLATVVAGASSLAACGPAKATTASPATSAPTVTESSPPLGGPSAEPSDQPGPAGSSSAGPSSGTCKASAMTEATYGGNGTAGTVYTGIVLTNKSSAPCAVTGYPTVAFVDAGGKLYKVQVEHITGTTASKVTVAAGGKAYFTVQLSDVPVNNQKAPCQPAAAGMLISLSSDGSSPVTDKGPWRACGIAHVGPVTAKPDPNLHK
jgi:hypothetical protein